MNRFFSSGLILSVFLLFVLIESSFQQQTPVNGLWQWRQTTNYRVSQTPAGDITVTVLRGNLGPYSGRVTGPNSIRVNFGPKCCTGQVSHNGTRIVWSNKTNWTLSDLPVLGQNRNNTAAAATRRPTKASSADYLLRIANRLSDTRKKILALVFEVQQNVQAAVSYAQNQGRNANVLTSLNNAHKSAQSFLQNAHGSVLNVENSLRTLGPKATPKPTTRPTTPRPTTTRPTPRQDPNDPAVKLQNWFHRALSTAQSEAASDLNQIDGFIKGIADTRKESRTKNQEAKDKRAAAKRKKKEERADKRREDKTKRRQAASLQRHQRRVAYEHFRKRNPSQAEIDKLNDLRRKERKLRRDKSKEQRKKRRQERKQKRKERRERAKVARKERQDKRAQQWRASMSNITADVELIAKKTIITLGHTIQEMQQSLVNASQDLERLSSSCRQADHLKAKFQQATNMTETMKALATRTINGLKVARTAIASEESRHNERVEKRKKAADAKALQERIEERNKRRARQRRAEVARKKARRERERGRKERETKREANRKKSESQQKESDAKRQQQQEKDQKSDNERRTKRESKSKAEDRYDQGSALADQIKKAIQGVVDGTQQNLQANLQTIAPRSKTTKTQNAQSAQQTTTGGGKVTLPPTRPRKTTARATTARATTARATTPRPTTRPTTAKATTRPTKATRPKVDPRNLNK